MTIDYSVSIGNLLTLVAIVVMAAGAFRKLIAIETKINILWTWFEEHILKAANPGNPE